MQSVNPPVQNDLKIDDNYDITRIPPELFVEPSTAIKIDASDLSNLIKTTQNINSNMGLIGTSTNVGSNLGTQLGPNTSWAYQVDSDLARLYPKPTEYKLLSGEKIIKLFERSNFIEVREMTLEKFQWMKKFPFFRKTSKKFTRVKYNDSKCGAVQYDIDCDLNFFMKHTDWEYTSWSANKMKYDLSQKEN